MAVPHTLVEGVVLNTQCLVAPRSFRDEVAQFLTHYCKSPNPLKADNVSVCVFVRAFIYAQC